MERYITQDGTIAKYVHDDGSETSIKTWPIGMQSCGGSGRDKFNVFASCSSGCPIKCSFCFLTSKGFPYNSLEYNDIAINVSDSIQSEIQRRPELKNVPFNLSWMGMGDPFIDLDKIFNATCDILENVESIVDKIEGIDIATTMPHMKWDDINTLRQLDKLLKLSGKLTEKPPERTNVRLFYSLHSMNEIVRRLMIPRTINVHSTIHTLNSISKEFNVIYHYLFLDSINDSDNDINGLIEFFYQTDRQLRILRYNQCPNSRYVESKQFDKIIDKLIYNLPNNLKVQLSPGSEINAACGMFLMGK